MERDLKGTRTPTKREQHSHSHRAVGVEAPPPPPDAKACQSHRKRGLIVSLLSSSSLSVSFSFFLSMMAVSLPLPFPALLLEISSLLVRLCVHPSYFFPFLSTTMSCAFSSLPRVSLSLPPLFLFRVFAMGEWKCGHAIPVSFRPTLPMSISCIHFCNCSMRVTHPRLMGQRLVFVRFNWRRTIPTTTSIYHDHRHDHDHFIYCRYHDHDHLQLLLPSTMTISSTTTSINYHSPLHPPSTIYHFNYN